MKTQCCAALATGQCHDCPMTAPMRPNHHYAADPAVDPMWRNGYAAGFVSVVYIVVSPGTYEGYAVLRAFEDESDAIAYRDACRTHEELRPRHPGMDSTDADEAAWDAATTAWIANEPPGFFSVDGNFEVATLPLVKARHSKRSS
jgi:hypothetical protein